MICPRCIAHTNTWPDFLRGSATPEKQAKNAESSNIHRQRDKTLHVQDTRSHPTETPHGVEVAGGKRPCMALHAIPLHGDKGDTTRH